ncbi:MAG: 2-succinylbenzoate--CoA ligase [Leptolyngbyaceae cyanobacterium bins.59]|nr:2-succinylbenzoate--CoA ligase [Leptolyngbyaceae cyanobacterium bins.59]
MATALAVWTQRQGEDWLIGQDSRVWESQVRDYLAQLRTTSQDRVLLVERHPLRFLAGFLAACLADRPVFLGNPDWGDREWEQVRAIVQPTLIWGDSPIQPCEPASIEPITARIMIPTGGTSGQLRFAMHTWETLTASVEGFRQYFQLDQVHSCCTLPLYHVSGLMQFLRSFTSGGRLAIVPFRSLETGQPIPIHPEESCLSLVPTQLQRLLDRPDLAAWLARFAIVLLGGAPAWDSLLDRARDRQIRLAPTYGMTETASQVVTLKPEMFLAGKPGSGQVLPHAQVIVRGSQGEPLPDNQMGTIAIQAQSLTLGYYPQPFPSPEFLTDDLGYFDLEGILHLIGRASTKIITGGENVFPAEVEAAIRATGMVRDVKVLGVLDPLWGQAVTALYVPQSSEVSVDSLKRAIGSQLVKFKHPKHWVAVSEIPRNAQGKLNEVQVKAIVQEFLHPSSFP